MPFQIVRNDITNIQADAIVNTANPRPVVGFGTDSRIHEKAGPQLLQARQVIGNIATGDAAITPAFGLQAKYVIHTVGPAWIDGNHGEAQLLRSCYTSALSLAMEHNCQSVAFPLISTGHYGFPKDDALQIAISAFSGFLTKHDMLIYLVVFDSDSFRLSEKLFQHVASYIDEHYIDEHYIADCAPQFYAAEKCSRPYARRLRDTHLSHRSVLKERSDSSPACGAAPKTDSLESFFKNLDTGFTETLLKLIDRSGKKDSDIYKKANLSKQHFSKIRNNPDYKPTKPTAIALALALELNLEETKDLLGRAGYALTNSSKFDLIILYFIQQRNYNLVEINIALYEFDQPLLGA